MESYRYATKAKYKGVAFSLAIVATVAIVISVKIPQDDGKTPYFAAGK